MNGKDIKVEFSINSEVFAETPNKKISNITLVFEYENPQSYGYPEVWHWSEEYEFDVDEIRRKMNGQD